METQEIIRVLKTLAGPDIPIYQSDLRILVSYMDYFLFVSTKEELIKHKKTYSGEFLVSPKWDVELLVACIENGYLPMAIELSLASFSRPVFAPKIHKRRAIIVLPQAAERLASLSNLQASLKIKSQKNLRSKSKRFIMTIDHAFDQVAEEIRRFHPHCWLYHQLEEIYKALLNQPSIPLGDPNTCDHQNSRVSAVDLKTRILSIEVWDAESGKLVAGEVGASFGAIYTSLTGFSNRQFSSSGSIQLACLAFLLIKHSFRIWDLGMMMDYKAEMGAKQVTRDVWLEVVDVFGRQHPSNSNIECPKAGSCFQMLSDLRTIESSSSSSSSSSSLSFLLSGST